MSQHLMIDGLRHYKQHKFVYKQLQNTILAFPIQFTKKKKVTCNLRTLITERSTTDERVEWIDSLYVCAFVRSLRHFLSTFKAPNFNPLKPCCKHVHTCCNNRKLFILYPRTNRVYHTILTINTDVSFESSCLCTTF